MRPKNSPALIHKGFVELALNAWSHSPMVVHVASQRVMEKAGLRLVRKLRQPWPDYIEGEEEGNVECALLRSEWEERTAEEVVSRFPR